MTARGASGGIVYKITAAFRSDLSLVEKKGFDSSEEQVIPIALVDGEGREGVTQIFINKERNPFALF